MNLFESAIATAKAGSLPKASEYIPRGTPRAERATRTNTATVNMNHREIALDDEGAEYECLCGAILKHFSCPSCDIALKVAA